MRKDDYEGIKIMMGFLISIMVITAMGALAQERHHEAEWKRVVAAAAAIPEVQLGDTQPQGWVTQLADAIRRSPTCGEYKALVTLPPPYGEKRGALWVPLEGAIGGKSATVRWQTTPLAGSVSDWVLYPGLMQVRLEVTLLQPLGVAAI